jgi:type II secretory pathway pseudopilin PulG
MGTRAPSHGRAAEAGYNMVMLIVAITVLSILVAAMLPLMSTEIRREKEEELVFRGFQYAEAIRIFHQRYQRYPNKLDELLEVKPRCIRQLWTDPMTKDGKWGLIFQNQGTPVNPQNPGNPSDPEGPQVPQAPQGPDKKPPPPGPTDGSRDAGQDPNAPPGLNTPKQGEVVATGPITGVYSKSSQTSFLVLYGHNRYDEWRFTEDLIRNGSAQRGSFGGAPGIGNPGQALIPSFSTRWLGRPWHFVDQAQPQNGTMPDGKGSGVPSPDKTPVKPRS